MLDDDNSIDTTPPGDAYEEELARTRETVSKRLNFWIPAFLYLQFLCLVVAYLGADPNPVLSLYSVVAIFAFLAIWSVIVALVCGLIVLRHFSRLRWPAIVFGLFPWFVIAGETTFVVLAMFS